MKNSNYNKEPKYDHYVVDHEAPLLEYLLQTLQGQSRSKTKATLQGRGVLVDGKCVTQFDFPLQPGMKVSVSKSKRNNQFTSRYVSIVYEDKYLIVVDKAPGILSMAAGHSSLNVKSVLDDYFAKSKQRCHAHVVHRLDRDTSGLLVYAKDMETEQTLEHNWHDIVYDRRYVAVLSGEMEEDGGTIANWLKDNKAYVTYSSPVDNGGKYAVTHFHTLARTTEHSLVEFKLDRDARTKSACMPPTWAILSAATRNTAMATTPCIASASMPACSASIIQSHGSAWSLSRLSPRRSRTCLNENLHPLPGEQRVIALWNF